ncbi:MAG: HAD family hydrolase [Eubacteriales bacterium]
MINKDAIKCVIFDMDGTLTDSMSIWDQAGGIYLQSKGVTPHSDWREITKPMSMTQIAEYFTREYHLTDSMEEIMEGVDRVVEDYYRNVAMPKEGALELLELLKQNQIHICLATATDQYLVELVLKRTGIYPYLERLYTCTGVGYGKDRPEIYQIAANSFGLRPDQCLVFEDAFYALKTAHEAGFPTISVYDDSAALDEEKKRKIADLSIRSFREILPEGTLK